MNTVEGGYVLIGCVYGNHLRVSPLTGGANLRRMVPAAAAGEDNRGLRGSAQEPWGGRGTGLG